MAYVKKCDRCGTYFDWNPMGYNQIMIENSYAIRSKLKKFDICPTCMKRFTQWINDKGVVIYRTGDLYDSFGRILFRKENYQ